VSAAPRVIAVDRVSKRFRLPQERVHTLKERALHPLRQPGYEQLNALRNISFDVGKGEFFGIVGRNGSGKSTLLKCLASIYRVDQGAIYVDGRMSTFIELGVGFNPDLAARDNVMINATMLGLSSREARRRFDQILDFAELHDFVDLKLKNYSSGMMVRLAFSVAIQVDADILLIDEVLAVGDAAFQQKCFDEFVRIRKSGVTVMLVTHDMSSVERFCDRALLLEHGRMADIGDTARIGSRYLELNFSSDARAAEQTAAADEETGELAQPPGAGIEPEAAQPVAEPTRYGDGRAEMLDAWFQDDKGSRTDVLHGGRPAAFCMRVLFAEHVEDPVFGVSLRTTMGDHVLAANSQDLPPAGAFAPGDEVVVRIAFDNILAPGRYEAGPAVAQLGVGLAWLDYRPGWVTVVVAGMHATGGALVDIPFELAIERQSDAGVAAARGT